MPIISEPFKLEDIAAISVYDADEAGKRPIVLLLHGAGSGKESGLEAAHLLASAGYFAVVFDASGYGESPYAAQELKDPLDIFIIYRETSGYINRLIRHLAEHPAADAERVGLIGFSMGAHIIYYYLAQERLKAVKAAVPISGSPRWDNIVRRFIVTFNQFRHLGGEETIQDYERQVSAFHPLPLLNELSELPLLILTGENDDKVPAADLEAFYHRIERNYSSKEQVKLTVYSGVGHKFTADMMSDGMEWFKKYL
ncbi:MULTISPECIES: alpha/beta hydrolase family protein [unclassified Paenibacillus]|uniref:alpha/beta hydrolase family protein n=1 Tax=unclassified Paenibacillus TaxID=185978 RepID=UPI0036379C4D